MQNNKVKNLELETSVVDEESGVAEVVINSGQIDREGERIAIEGIDTENFMKNPVLMLSHDYNEFPIGKFTRIWLDSEKGLMGAVKFAKDQLKVARDAYELVKAGFLKGVSIGVRPLESEEQDGVTVYTKSEMLEASLVSIPADAKAGVVSVKSVDVKKFKKLMNGEITAKQYETVQKKALPFGDVGKKAPEDATWDGPAEVAKAEGATQLKRMHAWIESGADAEAKSSYKLPYRRADGTLVWAGVRAAMAALLGARGGVQIPESDRGAVYNVLKSGYEAFEKDAPAMKDYTERELHKLFDIAPLENEADNLVSLMEKAVKGLKSFNSKAKEMDGEDKKKFTNKAYELSKIITELSERSNANLRVRKRQVTKVRVKFNKPKKVIKRVKFKEN